MFVCSVCMRLFFWGLCVSVCRSILQGVNTECVHKSYTQPHIPTQKYHSAMVQVGRTRKKRRNNKIELERERERGNRKREKKGKKVVAERERE